MKTVRLPIYNENGQMSLETLEVDLDYFLRVAYSRDMMPNAKARIIPPTFSESDMKLMEAAKEEVQLVDVASKHPEGFEPLTREELQMLSAQSFEDLSTEDDIWMPIEKIPSKNFEINRDGFIRHTLTKRVIAPEWDIDQFKYRVRLTINGVDYSIDGPALAQEIFARV